MTDRRPILYVDMDNTLVDFGSAFGRVDPELFASHEDKDDIPGIFALMDPVPGAIEAVHALAEHFDVYVLSTAPWANPSAWGHKLEWIKTHFGSGPDSVLYKRLILSHHKDLNRGAYLIDDRPNHRGADRFEGAVIPFGTDEFPDWPSVVAYLARTVTND